MRLKTFCLAAFNYWRTLMLDVGAHVPFLEAFHYERGRQDFIRLQLEGGLRRVREDVGVRLHGLAFEIDDRSL